MENACHHCCMRIFGVLDIVKENQETIWNSKDILRQKYVLLMKKYIFELFTQFDLTFVRLPSKAKLHDIIGPNDHQYRYLRRNDLENMLAHDTFYGWLKNTF